MYYLTAARDGFPGEGRAFIDFADARNAYDARAEVDLQAKIWVRLPKDTLVATAFGKFDEHKAGSRLQTTIGRIIFNVPGRLSVPELPDEQEGNRPHRRGCLQPLHPF